MATSATDRKREQRERDKKLKLHTLFIERLSLKEKKRIEALYSTILKERKKVA